MVSTLIRPNVSFMLRCAFVALAIVVGTVVLSVCADGPCDVCGHSGLGGSGSASRPMWRAVRATLGTLLAGLPTFLLLGPLTERHRAAPRAAATSFAAAGVSRLRI